MTRPMTRKGEGGLAAVRADRSNVSVETVTVRVSGWQGPRQGMLGAARANGSARPRNGINLAFVGPRPRPARPGGCGRSGRRGHDAAQVIGIAAAPQAGGAAQHAVLVDEVEAEGDLLRAGDLDALTVLDGAHEGGGLVQAVVRAGVEPREAPAEPLHAQVAA